MKRGIRGTILVALGVALLLAVFVSPHASSSPDGLERVAEDKGFLERAEAEGVTVYEAAPLPDYSTPGVQNEGLSTALSGLIGTLGTFLVGWGLALLLRRRRVAQA